MASKSTHVITGIAIAATWFACIAIVVLAHSTFPSPVRLDDALVQQAQLEERAASVLAEVDMNNYAYALFLIFAR